MPRRRFPIVSLLAVLTAGALTGCAPSNKDMLHFLQERKHQVSAIEYRVNIPDILYISAPRVLEINATRQRIGPDGKINLKLLGEVKVVGLTAKEIAAKLEVLLGKYYVDPKVRVRIDNFASKRFYVYGEGVPNGAQPYTGRDTLIDVVAPAVSNYLAWTSRTQITRPGTENSEPKTITVNVNDMLATGDWSDNILLEPDDVVYVPPTPIAWFGHRVRELIYPVQPAVQAYVAPAYIRDANDQYDDEAVGRGVATQPATFNGGGF